MNIAPEVAIGKNMQHRSFQGFKVEPKDDYLASRVPVLVNDDCYVILAAPTAWGSLQSSVFSRQSSVFSRQSTSTIDNRQSTIDNSYFFKNSDGHEMIFVHEGEGVLRTMYGNLPFGYGDHLISPRGVIYQLEFKTTNNRLFIVESFSPYRFPKRYVSRFGQLLEHAPYYERDIRKPQDLETHDEMGDFTVIV